MTTITNTYEEARNMLGRHKSDLKNISYRVSNTVLYQELSLGQNVTFFSWQLLTLFPVNAGGNDQNRLWLRGAENSYPISLLLSFTVNPSRITSFRFLKIKIKM